uniref:Uncharacterized protein n=1 Tax=Anguilla anguilla TaxID=7936 RepID=A0A0E9U1E1_ANGAN
MPMFGWYLSLQPFNFTVHYRTGSSNHVVDCLFRIPEGESSSNQDQEDTCLFPECNMRQLERGEEV